GLLLRQPLKGLAQCMELLPVRLVQLLPVLVDLLLHFPPLPLLLLLADSLCLRQVLLHLPRLIRRFCFHRFLLIGVVARRHWAARRRVHRWVACDADVIGHGSTEQTLLLQPLPFPAAHSL